MRFLRITLILGVLALVTFSCDEEQLRQADRIVGDVNQVSTGARAVLESPAGKMVPDQARLLIELALGLVGAGAITYQKWRSGIMAKTTKAIVKGVEKVDRAGQDNPVNPIKDSIGYEMRQAGIYDAGNKIVDRLKIAR